MNARTAGSDDFIGPAADLLLGRKRKKPAQSRRGRSLWTGAPVAARTRPEYPGRGSRADLTARLKAVASRRSQVVVKIPTKGRKTATSLAGHFRYLSRDGEEILRDQDGREFRDAESVTDLLWAWKHTGPVLDDDSPRKEAFHIIFSMREGTDERAVFGAVKASAELEFAGHQWVMVQHHDEPQVHVHVCVKTESLDGQRLNPRKADLQRWRERFAYELRERGVEAEATRRAPRLQREKTNKPWEVSQMEGRGEPSNRAPSMPEPGKAEGWRRVEKEVTGSYYRIVEALGASEDASDRLLSSQLSRVVQDRIQHNRRTDRDRPGRGRDSQLERG